MARGAAGAAAVAQVAASAHTSRGRELSSRLVHSAPGSFSKAVPIVSYRIVWVKQAHRKRAHLVDGEAVAEQRERAERHERDEQHERRLHRVQIGLSGADLGTRNWIGSRHWIERVEQILP